MMNKKAITPIISVILLLMMSVAVAGIAWFWLQSMTQKVMSQTEAGTETQLTTLQSTLLVQGSSCNSSSGDVTIVVYNPSADTVSVTSAVIGGDVSDSMTAVDVAGSTADDVDFTFIGGLSADAGTHTATVNSNRGSVTFSVKCVA